MKKAKKRPRGRPATGRGVRVMVTIPAKLEDRMVAAAATTGVPLATWCRLVIVRALR